LWNRYSLAGDTLIGQAISMLGDPLQLIVILGRGSAGVWDIKFLAAKFLFCVGLGLLVLRLLGSRPLSLIYAALAAYCGAFFTSSTTRFFFVFSYAPWILLSALGLLGLRSGRHTRYDFWAHEENLNYISVSNLRAMWPAGCQPKNNLYRHRPWILEIKPCNLSNLKNDYTIFSFGKSCESTRPTGSRFAFTTMRSSMFRSLKIFSASTARAFSQMQIGLGVITFFSG